MLPRNSTPIILVNCGTSVGAFTPDTLLIIVIVACVCELIIGVVVAILTIGKLVVVSWASDERENNMATVKPQIL
jgi:hypothetical protein